MDSYIKSGDTWLHTAYMYTKVDGTWIMIFDSQKSNDSIAPGITIAAPTSTSSSSPTYYGDSATYRVYGTATDSESGVYAVYVNDQIATIDGNSWYYDITLTENETTTVSIYAVDNAGNESPVYTRYVYYDTVDPALTVTAPTGISSDSPTYYQSDSATSYTVSGTVSDTAGIQSVSVNGMAATISDGNWSITLTSLATNTTHTITVIATDNSGRTTTVNRYLRVEAYYQQATRIAGAEVQNSLADTLTNGTVCASLTANATAYEIMKSHYSSDMIAYIDSNYSSDLNKLNYVCKLKAYLFRNGYDTGLFSGFTVYTENSTSVTQNSDNLYMKANSYACVYKYWSSKLTLSGYSSLGWKATGSGYVGLSDNSTSNSTSNVNTTMNKARATFTAGSLSISSYNSAGYYYKFGCCNGESGNFYSLWITP